MKAIWKDTVIAESDATVIVEGNHYFPVESVSNELLQDSDTTSACPWKGTANYYTLAVEGHSPQSLSRRGRARPMPSQWCRVSRESRRWLHPAVPS